MKNSTTSKELLKKYYDFLNELYNTSRNQSFIFSEMITKHKIGKSIQTVLTKNSYVIKDGKLWKWNSTKPTKVVTEDIILLLQEYNASAKTSVKTKKQSKDIKQSLAKDDNSNVVIIEESIELNTLVESYTKLENDLKEMTVNYNNYMIHTSKTIEELTKDLNDQTSKNVLQKIANDMLTSENAGLNNDKLLLNNGLDKLNLKYVELTNLFNDVKSNIISSNFIRVFGRFDKNIKLLLEKISI